ncbi:hypothetical protein DYU11_09995 [Fibrisoma montanum]|uniref:Uncharacterized protein n=1 Tax=Fibrisoma montanum TaxID=2305895 RepID=A0A418MAF5_9BACT|nr:hypothetical protein DYU11_09995 [Fibrisoma montanum]
MKGKYFNRLLIYNQSVILSNIMQLFENQHINKGGNIQSMVADEKIILGCWPLVPTSAYGLVWKMVG